MILITGGRGEFGKALTKIVGKNILAPGRRELDMQNKESIDSYVRGILTDKKDVRVLILNAYKPIGQYIQDYDYRKIDIEKLHKQISDSILLYNLNIYLTDMLMKHFDLKYVMFLTTGLSLSDTNHPEYRALKVYGKDLLYRYFKCIETNTKVFSVHPGHMGNESQYIEGAKFVRDLAHTDDNIKSYRTYLRFKEFYDASLATWYNDDAPFKYINQEINKI